jgi:hypothetical protein
MPQSTVASKVHESLDVHGYLGPEITFHFVVRVDDLSDGVHLCICQIIGFRVPTDAGLIENLLGRGAPDTVDISQSNLDALILG